MMSRPEVKFIDHDPPKDQRGGSSKQSRWSGYVVGILATEPGRWAEVVTGNTNKGVDATNLRNQAQRLGIEVETVVRDYVLYARAVVV